MVLGGLFLLAILTQSCDSYLFQGFNYDKVIQASAGQASLDGRGYSTPAVDEAGRITWSVAGGWPPAYSWIFARAIQFTADPFRAAYAIDVAAVMVFIAAWARIFTVMAAETGPRVAVLFWVYWAVVFSPVRSLPSSDVAALASYSVAMAFTLTLPSGAALWRPAAAGLAAGVGAAFRFAYWPLEAIPMLPWVFPWRTGTWRRVAAYQAAALIPIGWVVATLNHAFAPPVGPRIVSPADLHWIQLLRMPPFGAAVLGLDGAWQRLAVARPFLRPALAPLLWTTTIVVLAIGAVEIARWIGQPRSAARHAFGLMAASTAIVTFGVVGVLTVRTPAFRDGWTVASDTARYVVPTFPFLLLALIERATRDHTWLARAAVALLVVSALSVTGYRVGQVAYFLHGDPNAHVSGPRYREDIRAVFGAVRRARTGNVDVLYCDDILVRQYIAIVAGAAAPRAGCSDQIRASTNAGQIVTARRAPDGRLALASEPGPYASAR